MLVNILYACSYEGNSENSKGEIQNASEKIESVQTVSLNGEVSNSQSWQGIVQIDGLVIRPYSGFQLKSFEDAGFQLKNNSFNKVASQDTVELEKDGVQVHAKLSYDKSKPQKYRDCAITYISYISLSDRKDSEIQVWIHDGIKLGESVEQLTSQYPYVAYHAKDKSYEWHPLSSIWERKGVSQGSNYLKYDYQIGYGIDDEMNIVDYSLTNGEALKNATDKIEYKTKSINDERGGDYHAIFQEPQAANAGDYSTANEYPICVDGEKGAKIFFERASLSKKEDDSKCEIVYQTEQYTVSRRVNPTLIEAGYQLYTNDENNMGYGIDFHLMILDSDGNIVDSNPDRRNYTGIYGLQGYGDKYGVADGQKNIVLNPTPKNQDGSVPYAYFLAIDIFDHIAQYTVSAGYVETEL